MSIGIYLASYQKLKQTPRSTNCLQEFSVNELRKLDNFAEIALSIESDLGMMLKDIDPNEKMFVFLEEEDLAEKFSVKRDRDKGTINHYTDQPFIYHVDIYDWKNFYREFSEYLQSLNSSFELWKIREDEVALADLKKIELLNLDSRSLERILDGDEYWDPLVCNYDLYRNLSEED